MPIARDPVCHCTERRGWVEETCMMSERGNARCGTGNWHRSTEGQSIHSSGAFAFSAQGIRLTKIDS